MSFADDEELNAFAYRDGALAHMSAQAVGDALLDFQLTSECNLGWMAMAVRRALAATIPNASDGPDRRSNAEIRDELITMSELVGSAWVRAAGLSNEADDRLWDYSLHHWEGVNALAAGDDPSFAHNRFKRAVRQMEWLSTFLRQVAQQTEAPRGNWRGAEVKRMRVERGQYLAPIFEAFFQQNVSANNWPSDARHAQKTPFMDFYQRMVSLAFGEHCTPDISGVLKAACRLHLESPVQFTEDWIPGLSGAQLPPRQ